MSFAVTIGNGRNRIVVNYNLDTYSVSGQLLTNFYMDSEGKTDIDSLKQDANRSLLRFCFHNYKSIMRIQSSKICNLEGTH